MALLANRPADNGMMVPLAAISLAMALGVLESKALGVFDWKTGPILALCALPWLTVFFCRRPLSLVILWLAVLFYEEVVHDAFFMFPAIGHLGSILLLPMDIPYFFTFMYLLTIAATRPHELRTVIKDYPFLTLFLLIVLVSVIVYTPIYGKMAIGEARKSFFYFLFPVLALVCIKTFANLYRLLLAVFFLAVGVSVLGYIVLLFMGFSAELRPISAGGALILLLAVFSVLVAHTNDMIVVNNFADNLMVGMSLPMILIPHHRTVFLTAIVGLFVLFAFHRHKVGFVVKMAAISVMLMALISVAFMLVPRFEGIFMKAVAGIEDPGSDATASWRMEGWQKQLTALSASQVLLGEGLGSYYNWDMGNWQYSNVKVRVSPHNAYVEILLKLGLLGLAIYLALVFSFFKRMLLMRQKVAPGFSRACIEISVVNFAAIHAMMTGYDLSLIGLVFYAIGVVAVMLLQDEAATAQRQEMSRENLRRYLVPQSAITQSGVALEGSTGT